MAAGNWVFSKPARDYRYPNSVTDFPVVAFISSGSSANAPSAVIPQAVTITGTTLAVGSSVNAPTVAYTVAGRTIYAGSYIPATETLWVDQASSDANLGVNSAGRQNCQTISGHSGALTSISLWLSRGATALTGEMYLEVRQSTFNGTLLATSLPVQLSTLTTSATWINFLLPGALVLDSGTTYWIEEYISQIPVTSNVALFVSTADPYAGGSRATSNGTLVPAEDWRFRLYTGTSHSVEVVLAITTNTIASGSSVTAPTVIQTALGATIASGSSVNQPTVAYAIAGQTIYSVARALYTETLLFGHDTSNSGINAAAAGRNMSQTISGHAGLVVSISLFLRRAGTPLDAIYLELRESTFNGTLLATSAPIAGVDLSTSLAWVNFLIPPVQLVAGTTYWIESYFTRAVFDGSNSYVWSGSSGDLYAGGEAKNSLGNQYNPGIDLNFRLYTGTSHSVAYAVSGNTIASGSSVTAPSNVEAASSDQAVTGTTIAVGSAVTAPTITVGAVTVTGTTIAVGSAVSVPTVAPGAVTITGTTLAVGSQVFAATVAVGPVAATGATITSGSQVFAVTVIPQAVTITGTTIAVGSQVFTSTVTVGAVTIVGTTLAVGSQVFASTITVGAVTITGGTIPVGSSLSVVSVALTITETTIGSTSTVFIPTVAQTVTGATIASTASLFSPTVARQFSFTGSGGLIASGTVSPLRGFALTPVGQAVFGGSATFVLGGVQTYSLTGAGAISTSGAASIVRGRVVPGAGTVTLGGSATLSTGRVITASGTITATGTVIPLRGMVVTPTAGIISGGAATITSTSGQSFSITGAGGLVGAGTASFLRGVVLTSAGGLQSAGVGNITTTGGSEATFTIIGAGTIISGGSAFIAFKHSPLAVSAGGEHLTSPSVTFTGRTSVTSIGIRSSIVRTGLRTSTVSTGLSTATIDEDLSID